MTFILKRKKKIFNSVAMVMGLTLLSPDPYIQENIQTFIYVLDVTCIPFSYKDAWIRQYLELKLQTGTPVLHPDFALPKRDHPVIKEQNLINSTQIAPNRSYKHSNFESLVHHFYYQKNSTTWNGGGSDITSYHIDDSKITRIISMHLEQDRHRKNYDIWRRWYIKTYIVFALSIFE